MLFTKVTLAISGLAVLAECASIHVGHTHAHMHQIQTRRRSPNQVFERQSANTTDTCLALGVLATASALTGQEIGTLGIAAGQAPSSTDPANFINFCDGQTITNGSQKTTGSCNPIPMGKIPATSNMVSSIITNPVPGQKVSANVTFNVTVQLSNIELGKFTNPTTTYYSAPQDLNAAGDVIGHCHVTIQDLGGSFTPTTPLDATKFAFFLGINDAGDGNGGLSATVTGGLAAGFYRVCTINSAANHQTVSMPIAKRGAQDDCTKFEVVDDGKATVPVSSAAAAGGVSTSVATASLKGSGSGTTVVLSTITKVQTTTIGGKATLTTVTDVKTTTIIDSAPASTAAVVVGSGSKAGSGSKSGSGGGKRVVTKTITKVQTTTIAGQATTITVTNIETTTVTDAATIATGVAAIVSSDATCPIQVTSTSTVIVTPTPSSASVSTVKTVSAISASATGSASTSGPGPALLPITDSGDADRPFMVNGNTFVNKAAAAQRACDIQFNACANAVNSGVLPGPLSLCTKQQTAC